MKKLFILLALVFIVTGCSNTFVTDDDIENAIDQILSSETELSNQYFSGYQYYLPREVALIDKYDYNNVLLYKSNTIYLYVDIISYYHQVEKEYTVDEDIYFSKVLEYDDKIGYINITLDDNRYYVEIEYNYGRIEGYTDKENLKGTILNSIYILKSIEYNDNVIESLIGENKIEYQEETFDLFKSDSTSDDYLDIADEDSYISDSEEKLVDDDSIILDDEDDLSD